MDDLRCQQKRSEKPDFPAFYDKKSPTRQAIHPLSPSNSAHCVSVLPHKARIQWRGTGHHRWPVLDSNDQLEESTEVWLVDVPLDIPEKKCGIQRNNPRKTDEWFFDVFWWFLMLLADHQPLPNGQIQISPQISPHGIVAPERYLPNLCSSFLFDWPHQRDQPHHQQSFGSWPKFWTIASTESKWNSNPLLLQL